MSDEIRYGPTTQQRAENPLLNSANERSELASATGYLAQWQELARAALKICDMRPHPRSWWDGDMDEDKEKEYEAAMEQVDNLKEKLGLDNDKLTGDAGSATPTETESL